MKKDNTARIAYSVRETAARLGVDQKTVRRGIRLGQIPHVDVGDRVLVPAAYLERIEEQGTA